MAGLHGSPKRNDSVFLSTQLVRHSPLCAPHRQPQLCSSTRFTENFYHLYKKKIIQPLDITLLSKQGLFFFFLLLIKAGNFLIWFLDGTLAVFSVKGVLLGDGTGAAVQGHWGRSVGVHAVSLVIPRALL